MTTLDLQPFKIALEQARETEVRTSWGTFSGRLWPGAYGWLANASYRIGDDVTIHRCIPRYSSQEDATRWLQQAFDQGPRFILSLLEDM